MKEALSPGSYPCSKSDRVVWVVGYPGLNLEGSRTGMLGGYSPPLSLLLSDETSHSCPNLFGFEGALHPTYLSSLPKICIFPGLPHGGSDQHFCVVATQQNSISG